MSESGSCLCGSVSLEYKSEPNFFLLCHCTDCQKATGSPVASIIGVPENDFIINGETNSYKCEAGVTRSFCINCGSGVLSYAKELSRIMFIKAGTLDNSDWIKIESNFFTKSASHWSKPDNTIESFKENPGLMKNIKTLLKSF